MEVEPLRLTRADMDHILKWGASKGVSDIIFQPGEAVCVYYKKEVHRITRRALSIDEVNGLIKECYTPTAPTIILSAREIPFGYEVEVSREERINFRGMATGIKSPHSTEVGIEICFRAIPSKPPTCEEVKIPQAIIDASTPDDGIIIISGPTGSGKTNTMGALMGRALQILPKRVLTYEAPIEFNMSNVPNRRGTVAQTEIPRHLETFKDATANSLRRKPDMILIGEARDTETIEGVCTLSNTGHCVYTTTHTNDVASTIARLADMFPPDSRWQMAMKLIEATRMIIHQRLVKTPEGNLTALREYLIFDEQTRRKIAAGGPDRYQDVIRDLLKERGQRLIDEADRLKANNMIREDEYKKLSTEFGGSELPSLSRAANG